MIKYEDIELANEAIKTMPIKTKNGTNDYAEVSQRVKAFRKVFPLGTICTNIVSLENGIVIIRAEVYDGERLLGTGTAYEKENSTFINKTSYIENCETSAVGRALGMCGFGIDVSIASCDEVSNAIENQNVQSNSVPKTNNAYSKPTTNREKLIAELKTRGIDIGVFAKENNLTKDSTDDDYKLALDKLIA